MGLFHKKDKPPKDQNSVEFRRYMGRKLDGREVRYALERENGIDKVIGKDGFITVHDGVLSVICGGKTVFRVKVDELEACWEFLSLEGVFMTAFDMTTNKKRTVMAYYTYYLDKNHK